MWLKRNWKAVLLVLSIIGVVYWWFFVRVVYAEGPGELAPTAGPGNWVKIGSWYLRPGMAKKGSNFSADKGSTWVSADQAQINGWIRPA